MGVGVVVGVVGVSVDIATGVDVEASVGAADGVGVGAMGSPSAQEQELSELEWAAVSGQVLEQKLERWWEQM